MSYNSKHGPSYVTHDMTCQIRHAWHMCTKNGAKSSWSVNVVVGKTCSRYVRDSSRTVHSLLLSSQLVFATSRCCRIHLAVISCPELFNNCTRDQDTLLWLTSVIRVLGWHTVVALHPLWVLVLRGAVVFTTLHSRLGEFGCESYCWCFEVCEISFIPHCFNSLRCTCVCVFS